MFVNNRVVWNSFNNSFFLEPKVIEYSNIQLFVTSLISTAMLSGNICLSKNSSKNLKVHSHSSNDESCIIDSVNDRQIDDSVSDRLRKSSKRQPTVHTSTIENPIPVSLVEVVFLNQRTILWPMFSTVQCSHINIDCCLKEMLNVRYSYLMHFLQHAAYAVFCCLLFFVFVTRISSN